MPSQPLNRQDYLFEWESQEMISVLVPKYATAASVKKDGGGYWLNVSWRCGITAPLTIQETIQALEERTNA